MEVANRLQMIALGGLPSVQVGDDLGALIIGAIGASATGLAENDVLVLAQKIVSKAEGRLVDLYGVTPSRAAREIAEEIEKDPRLVELILAESVRIVRKVRGLIIVEHRLGWIMANGGVDQSNLGTDDPENHALLLPVDPDGSAATLRRRLSDHFGVTVGVIINDSFGRPWRNGTVGVALGAAGVPAVLDRRGHTDLFGRTLRSTQIAFADEIAAAASLMMGQADEGRPAVLVRGLCLAEPHQPATALIRPKVEDLFR